MMKKYLILLLFCACAKIASAQFTQTNGPYGAQVSLRVYNLSGKEVYSQTNALSSKIDLSHLAKGMYFISISASTGSQTLKFIID